MSSGDPVVFVVDDDVLLLRAITGLLESAGHTVEAFSNARDFLNRDPHSGSGCVIVDLLMPDISGLGLLEALRRADHALSVILLSGHGDVSSTVKAMKAGAFDFLTKPVDERTFLRTIAEALKRSEEARQERREREELRRRFALLTPREREVCLLVARGLLNKQIAGELGTVEKTIKVHRARVMEKLEASSVVELFRICQEALTNVARHAAATEVKIRLAVECDWLSIEVRDNGKGVSPAVLALTRSLGVLGMRERARIAGGEFEIGGSGGQGVTVVARLPFRTPSEPTVCADSAAV